MLGVNVFSYDKFGDRQVRVYLVYHRDYRSSSGALVTGGGRNRRELDGFPIDSFRGSANCVTQFLRGINGNEKGK